MENEHIPTSCGHCQPCPIGAVGAVVGYSQLCPYHRSTPQLIAALETFMGWLESGMLVRDITKDGQSGWTLNMMHFVKDLGEIGAVIQRAKKASPPAKERHK
jgi:hypothetical protein